MVKLPARGWQRPSREFERTRLFNRFNAKADYFAVEQSGDGGDVSSFRVDGDGTYAGIPSTFRSIYSSRKEAEGLALFNAVDKGNCAACHVTAPTADSDGVTPLLYGNVPVPPTPKPAP